MWVREKGFVWADVMKFLLRQEEVGGLVDVDDMNFVAWMFRRDDSIIISRGECSPSSCWYISPFERNHTIRVKPIPPRTCTANDMMTSTSLRDPRGPQREKSNHPNHPYFLSLPRRTLGKRKHPFQGEPQSARHDSRAREGREAQALLGCDSSGRRNRIEGGVGRESGDRMSGKYGSCQAA